MVGPMSIVPLCKRCIDAGVAVELENADDEIHIGDGEELPTLDLKIVILVPDQYLQELML